MWLHASCRISFLSKASRRGYCYSAISIAFYYWQCLFVEGLYFLADFPCCEIFLAAFLDALCSALSGALSLRLYYITLGVTDLRSATGLSNALALQLLLSLVSPARLYLIDGSRPHAPGGAIQ